MKIDLPSYSQRDSKWANDNINGTSSTIGRYGCTLTCIGEVVGKNPRDANKWLKSLGAFTKDLVLWTKIPKWVFRFYCTDKPAPLTEIKKYLKARKPVLLNVSFSKNPSKPDHWVLATGYENDTIYINDPWYGDKTTVSPRYGKTSAIAILGGAYFDYVIPAPKPPAPPPPPSDPCKGVKEELSSAKNDLDAVTGRLEAKEQEIKDLTVNLGKLKLELQTTKESLANCQAQPPQTIEKPIEELSVGQLWSALVSKLFKKGAE